MRNSRLFYILLVALNFWGTSGTVQLDEFLKAVADARLELGGFEGGSVDRTRMGKRSASIGELLARFDSEYDEAGQRLEGGDAWYQSFRAMECQHGGGGCRKSADGPFFPASVKSYGHERREGRKLLSVEYTDHENALIHGLDLEEFDNLKQKTPLDRQLGGLMFDNAQVGHEGHDKKNSVVRTAAFEKLQNYLKENQNQSNGQRTTTVPLNLAENDRDVNIKLHMSVNATVLGEDKLPQGFRRNQTIIFKPPSEMSSKRTINEEEADSLATVDDDFSRDRRRVMFPIRSSNDDISKYPIEDTDHLPLDEVISGQLTSQLVKAVFEHVQRSPTLKVLWPGLMRNKVASGSDVQDFDVIRTLDTESEVHRAEIMFRQAMDAINAIIDQQVRSRSCVPLRSDLEAFYRLIIESQAENERLQTRRKRESHDVMSDPEIRMKSKTVKKLLKDYEELPRDDQQKVASVKRSLLVAAQQLRELQQQSKRRKRQILELHRNDNHTSPSAFETRDSDHVLSPEYTRLVKTAELLQLQNAFTDPDLPLGLSYI